MNAVYYLPAAKVVLRIAPATKSAAVSRVARVATRLADLDQPTARLAIGMDKSIETPGWAATAWTYLEQTPGHRHRQRDLAKPLLAMHGLHDLGISLPDWDPVGRSRGRVEEAAVGSDLDFLSDWSCRELRIPLTDLLDQLLRRCSELETAVASAEWALPIAVIHGDAHAGNLLTSPDRGVVLCDLDSVTLGPPEWDLVPSAHGVERFGDPRDHYGAFAAEYGFDLLHSPNWPLLRDIRELQLVTSVIAGLRGRPEVAVELGHRLRSFIARDDQTWHRYR
nr:phosphotransferase [Kribbella italica]